MNFLSNLFRTLNGQLITTDNVIIEKILKLCFAVSVRVYRYDRNKPKKKQELVIENFAGNIRMKVDRARSMGASLYWTGFHEFRELFFLHWFLKPEMTFVDVGANQGEYSLFAAKRLSKGTVMAFEPLASIREVFEENIRLNGFNNIQVFDCGLSDKNGSLDFHEIEGPDEGLGTLYLGDKKSKSVIRIPLRSLDEIVQELSIPKIDFIKLDIEGGELNALKGSVETIRKYKPVIMIEINDATYKAAGYSTADIENLFTTMKYEPYEIGKRGRLIKCSSLPTFGNLIYKSA
jgi:FkbM family methyltransferase